MPIDLTLNTDLTVSNGCLLLSEPLMTDPNFERSVVLICEHSDETGSFGLVLNKPTELAMCDVTDLEYVENPLYLGGPVEQNVLHYVHTFADLDEAIPLRDGVFWGGNFEQLSEKGKLGQIDNTNCRFFMGYSGWRKDQLDEEIKENAWIISNVSLRLLFESQAENLWKDILNNMGGRYRIFANFPTDARLN
jgi:putative transcriptional regulator